MKHVAGLMVFATFLSIAAAGPGAVGAPTPAAATTQVTSHAKAADDVTLENLKFQHEILLSLIEKLMIGAAIALFALWTSRLLERYKAREAYISSFTQRHVQKVAEIWKMVYEWESFIEEGKPLDDFDDEQWSMFLDRMEQRIARSQLMAEELRKAVEADRFWLGKGLYSRFVAYHNLLRPYIAAMALRQQNMLKEIKTALDRNKQDIMSVVRANFTK